MCDTRHMIPIIAACMPYRQSGELVRTFSRHSRPVVAVAWLAGGKQFASASVDKSIILHVRPALCCVQACDDS